MAAITAIQAALLAVGVTASAAAPATVAHHAAHAHHVETRPMTERAILLQIDHRLGVIEQLQKTMLRGYETGGIYR